MTLYLNKPIYLHNSVRSYFSNLTKALEHHNESDAKTIDNCGSSLENHTFDSLKALIKDSKKLNFIFKEGGGKPAAGTATETRTKASTGTAESTAPATGTEEPAASTESSGGGGRVKRTRNLRNRGNNKSQKKRKRKHLNYTKK